MKKILVLLISFSCLRGTDSIPHKKMFRLGIENITDEFLKSLSMHATGTHAAALATNQTGIDRHAHRTIDLLCAKGVKLKKIFAPEHGLHGKVEAGKQVENDVDPITRLPVESLYKLGVKNIADEQLQGIAVIFFDMQDSGMRYYTYITTLYRVLDCAGKLGKTVVVLDRPNPLGRLVEGPVTHKDLISGIGIAQVPMRHGLTMGEIAQYFNEYELPQKAKLLVVPMQGYTSEYPFSTLLSPLSPNIQNLDACKNYSLLGLLGEVRPFDVGVGTEFAFKCMCFSVDTNIPKNFWLDIQNCLKQHRITSEPFAYYSTRRKQQMKGLKIVMDDMHDARSFAGFVSVIETCKKNKIDLSFADSFDKAIGTKNFRSMCDGTLTASHFVTQVNTEVDEYLKKAQRILLYEPGLHTVALG